MDGALLRRIGLQIKFVTTVRLFAFLALASDHAGFVQHEPFLLLTVAKDRRHIHVSGRNNSIIGNHFSEVIDAQSSRPEGAMPVNIRLVEGDGNYVATNPVVALDIRAASSGSAYAAQVDALLTTEASDALTVTTVMVDPGSTRNTILDSGSDSEVVADRTVNAVRAAPTIRP